MTLANYADANGVCWPGIDALAIDLCASQRSVIDWAKSLVAAGMIEIDHRGSERGGRKTNVYTLLIHRQSADSAPNQEVERGGLSADPAKKCAGAALNIKGMTRKKKPSVKNGTEKSVPASRGDFAESTVARLPPGWQPGPRAEAWIASHGLTVEQAEPAIIEFRDYWMKRTTRRKDWDAAFQKNGVVQASLIRIKRGHSATHSKSRDQRRDEVNKELDRQFESAVGSIGGGSV